MEEGLRCRRKFILWKNGVKFVKDVFNDAFNEGPGDFMATPACAGEFKLGGTEPTGCKKKDLGGIK